MAIPGRPAAPTLGAVADSPTPDSPSPPPTPESDLDALDNAIVHELQEDGRRSYREIARNLDVPEGTVRFRARRLMNDGVLRIVAIPDPFRLGYRVLAFLLLKVEPGRQRGVIDELVRFAEVTYVSSLAGRVDIYMQVVCRDHDHLFELLSDRIPGIGGILSVETFTELRMHKVSYIYPELREDG
jgi:Lrp/AsnC family transcriptional regulator, regulator for asnA, asnC and gidA